MKSERGAILIMMAISLLALTLFSAFVFDQGILYVSKRQAQNAADAAALAAAEHFINAPSDTAGATDAAHALAHANPVWLEQPAAADVLVDLPIVCPPGTGGGLSCVKVAVLRGAKDANNLQHTNYLPTVFLNVLGIDKQGINATATAMMAVANGTGCLRPWFLIDKYTDTNGDKQYEPGEPIPGYVLPDDLGSVVDFHADLSPSGYGEVNLSGKGGKPIEDAILHCAGGNYGVGDVIDGKPGGTQGPVNHGVTTLFGWDPDAKVELVDGKYEVVNSCATTSAGCVCDSLGCPNGPRVSPRVMTVAVCSPAEADCADGAAGNGQITVTNFLSFFMDDWDNGKNVIKATLIGTGGIIKGGGIPSEPFLHTIILVR